MDRPYTAGKAEKSSRLAQRLPIFAALGILLAAAVAVPLWVAVESNSALLPGAHRAGSVISEEAQRMVSAAVPAAAAEAGTLPVPDASSVWDGLCAEDAIMGDRVFQIGERAFDYFDFSPSGCGAYIRAVNDFSDKMSAKGVEVWSFPVPTGAAAMLNSGEQPLPGCGDQRAALRYLHDGMREEIHKVNVIDALAAQNDEYLYFRTDPHWTALGAYCAYAQFCAEAEILPAPLDCFSQLEQGKFLGRFCDMAPEPALLRADELVAYLPDGHITMRVTDAGGSEAEVPLVADLSGESPALKYLCFPGSEPLSVIINHDLPEAPKCLIVTDSFAAPMLPFLTVHYSTICAVDHRSCTAASLEALAEEYKVDQVIFLQSLRLLQSDDAVA